MAELNTLEFFTQNWTSSGEVKVNIPVFWSKTGPVVFGGLGSTTSSGLEVAVAEDVTSSILFLSFTRYIIDSIFNLWQSQVFFLKFIQK